MKFQTTRLERNSYGLYFTGQNIYYALVTGYLVTFLMFQGIDLSKTAAVMLIVKVWDAVNDALFGAIFDKVKFKSGQKCLPWIKLSTLLIAVTTVFLFAMPVSLSEGVKLIWFAAAYLLWDTAYTFCDVPIYTMVTTMTDNMQERNSLMARGRIFSGVGGGISMILCTVLVSEKIGLGFLPVSVILAILGTLLMLPICLTGKERNYDSTQEESYTLRQMFRYLRGNKYLMFCYGGQLIFGALGTGTTLGLFTSYYLFGSATFNLLLTAISALPALVLALFIPTILKRVDKFKLFIFCNVLAVIFGLVIFFVGYQNKTAFVILSVLRAVPLGAVGVMSFMFTPDCAEYGKFKTGIDAKGITFAIQTFTSKVTAAVASALGLFILKLFHWVTVEAESFAELEQAGVVQPQGALQGLWITYMLVPVIGAVLALVCYAFYRLSDKDVQIMAQCNAGEITREEAESRLSRKY